MHNRRSFILGGTAAAAALGLAACGGTGAGSGGPDPDAITLETFGREIPEA